MEYKKRGFFANIGGMFTGLVKPEEYIKNGVYGSGGSAVIIALIFAFLTPFLTVFLPYNHLFGNGKLARELESRIADFRIDADGFYCEEKYEWVDDTGRSYICVNTNKKVVDEDELDELIDEKHYNTIVIAVSQEVVLYSDDDFQKIQWSDMFNYLQSVDKKTIFSKQSVIDLIDKFDTPVIVIIYLFCAVASFVGFLICCAIWGAIGALLASAFGVKISYGDLFKASVYIRAIWYMLKKLVNAYLVYGMGTVMWTTGFVIILVYLMLAIRQFGKNHPANHSNGGFSPAGNIPNAMYDNNINRYNGNMYTENNVNYGGQQSEMNHQANSLPQNNQNNMTE